MTGPEGAFRFRGELLLPGERRRFELPAGRLPSGTWLTVPVEVIHGSRPGPAVWLSGAIHGDEIVGVEIIRHVVDSLDPASMAGTVVAVPVVNVFGFVTESRYLPDRRDLNRCFPGSRQGSLAARLARLFMDEVVEPCSFGLDYHAGSDDRINLPHLRGNLDDAETLRVALSFGAALVVHNKPQRGTLRAAALRRGKRVLLFEGGEPRRSTAWTRAPRGGIFRLQTKLGASVEKGQQVGTIADPAARDGSPVRARTEGLVLGHTVNPLVNPGDGILHIARLEEV